MVVRSLLYTYKFIFWTINRFFVILFIRRRFGVVVPEKIDIPKPPFIMVSNHSTFFDPWFVCSLSPYPMAIMMNEFGFNVHPIIRWYQKTSGAFPKIKGEADLKSLGVGLKKLFEGYPLLIFPEGQVTWDGETQPIFQGVEKVVKRLNVPLVMVNIAGSFLTKPWWASTYRKGKVWLSAKTLTRVEINNMSELEIANEIEKKLYNNDIKNTINDASVFKGERLAEGIEHFLWICRSCLSTDSIGAKGNEVFCSVCGSRWMLDSHCKLKALNSNNKEKFDIYDWAIWHRGIVMKEIEKASLERIVIESDDVEYCRVLSNGVVKTLKIGRLSLYKKELVFKTSDCYKEVFILDIDKISSSVFQKKDMLECHCDGKTYFFRFVNCSTMKWIYYLRYLQLYEQKKVYDCIL